MIYSRYLIVLMLLLICSLPGRTQETFLDRKVINGMSVELLEPRTLDFRVAHRFGDLFGDAGGWTTLYGLENAADVSIGFEYGLNDWANIGINRSAGNGPLKQLVNLEWKIRPWYQFGETPRPVSLAIGGVSSISTMPKNPNEEAINAFRSFDHRWIHTVQLMLARKISPFVSLQAGGAWTHRNIVTESDQNDLFSITAAGHIRLSKAWSVLFDFAYPLSDLRTASNGYYPIYGLGVAFNTAGGHVFQLNLTNAKALSPNDYLPYTRSDISEGEFRFGFTISRIFNL